MLNTNYISYVLSFGLKELCIRLSKKQYCRLISYLELVIKWNQVYNLTAFRNPMQIIKNHLLDSLAVTSAFFNAQHILDVGSGSGLPGIVLAIWAAEASPATHVSLVDSIHKKTAFLTQVKAHLHLTNVSIYTQRVEKLQTDTSYNIITSRAFAKLHDFIVLSNHLLAPNGYYIALKGSNFKQEIKMMPTAWRVFKIQKISSLKLNIERYLIFIKKYYR